MLKVRLIQWATIISVVVMVSLLLPLSSAVAQDDASYLKYRQKLMAAIGGNMGSIAAIVKGGLPFKDNIATHATAIQDASKLIDGAFKKEITEGKTDSKADIWKDWAKFSDAAKKLGAESGKLAEVAKSGDMAAIGAQLKATGKSCGGCHKPFRKPKEERFKR